MVLLGDDDLVVCHRAAYAHITPQACLDRHARDPKACGRCRLHVHCLRTMVEATEKDVSTLVEITRSGDISRHANPLVNTAVRADWEKSVNTHIVYINGIRARQGFVKEFRALGGMAERGLSVLIPLADIEKMPKGIREIAVDEMLAGRLIYRFEWNAAENEQNKPSTVDGKGGEKLASYRLMSVATDVFSR